MICLSSLLAFTLFLGGLGTATAQHLPAKTLKPVGIYEVDPPPPECPNFTARIQTSTASSTKVRYTLGDLSSVMPASGMGLAFVSGNGEEAGGYPVTGRNGGAFSVTWHSKKPIVGAISVTDAEETYTYCSDYRVG